MKIKITQESDSDLKIIALTEEQATALSHFLFISRGYRNGEIEAWKKLSHEIKEDGSPQYPVAKKNAEFWENLNALLENVEVTLNETIF